MGVVPRPVAEYVVTNQGTQIQMGYQPSSRVQVWSEYDSFAARVAAPIWLIIWALSGGKMGRGLWYWKEVNRTQGLPPGQTYTRDGNHFLVGQRRPLADNADLRPDSMFRSKKCTYGFTECSGRECHGRCTNVKGGP